MIEHANKWVRIGKINQGQNVQLIYKQIIM